MIQDLDELRKSLARMDHFPRPGTRSLGQSSAYQSQEQKLWSRERQIRARLYPEVAGPIPSPRVDAGILAALAPGEAILNFVASGGMTGAFVAMRNGVEYVPFGCAAAELVAAIRKLHFMFDMTMYSGSGRDGGARRTVDSLLADLYRRTVEPALAGRSIERMIVIADGFAAQIPFGALLDGDGVALRDRYGLVQIVNPQDLVESHNDPRVFSQARNAVFAVATPNLPSVEIEAQRIEKMFSGTASFTGSEATADRLREQLAAADGFVHIAAHASRSSENPLFSRILMGDGPFFPFDLFGVGLNACLTTLSGCQTAAPGLYYGNSFSLAKAFYQAGSRYVLASLWPVSDRMTMDFMTGFYDRIRRGSNVPAAFDSAIDEMRQEVDAPAYWGSFVLLGK